MEILISALHLQDREREGSCFSPWLLRDTFHRAADLPRVALRAQGSADIVTTVLLSHDVERLPPRSSGPTEFPETDLSPSLATNSAKSQTTSPSSA